MSASNVEKTIDLADNFPEAVTADERSGYEGYLVKPENLHEVTRYLRDSLGFDYLSSVTGVDYPAEGRLETVYHLYQSVGGSALVLKVQASRDNPVVPSLVPVYAGADLQEREAWDLLGIHYEGHPDLRRILMWEGFHGHPLRKDWREAYFEEETKPFKSRWPDGRISRAEDKNLFHKNVDYPAGLNPENL